MGGKKLTLGVYSPVLQPFTTRGQEGSSRMGQRLPDRSCDSAAPFPPQSPSGPPHRGPTVRGAQKERGWLTGSREELLLRWSRGMKVPGSTCSMK